MLHKYVQLPQLAAGMRLRVVLLVAAVVLTFTLVAAPHSIAVACEGGGATCHCPGC